MIKTLFKIIVMLGFVQSQANAGEVKMFTGQPPSAEEMGRLLFSSASSGVDSAMRPGGVKIKTRSVSFGKPSADIPIAADKSVNSVGLPIKFGYNSSEIMQESKLFLDEVGKMMSLADYADEKMLIEGHTDASGSDKYNLYLSKQRAEAVKMYLVKNHQIEVDRLFASGKGESTPLPNIDPYDATNRRVQFYQAPE